MKKIYVASSWRNEGQQELVRILRNFGHEVYDFKNPAPGQKGFSWKQVGFGQTDFYDGPPDLDQYLKALAHPVAIEGFRFDKDAMDWADTFVLMLPCGRSAHLEAGWASGAGKAVHVLLSQDKFEPELMYLLCSSISTTVDDLIANIDGRMGISQQ